VAAEAVEANGVAAGDALALANARLIDGTGAAARDGMTIRVSGGRIASVDDGRPSDLPPEATVIDCAGRTVLPGLIDAHAHIGSVAGVHPALARPDLPPDLQAHGLAVVARRLLAGGITTVRDVGATGDGVLLLREAISLGLLSGPRILASGRIVAATSPGARMFAGMYREADGPDDMRRAVREQIRRGADFIKVMVTGALTVPGEAVHPAQMTAAEFAAIVDEAHRMGLRVAAHAEGLEGIRVAVDGGADTIEHGEMACRAPELLDRMAAGGIVLIPTMTVFHRVSDPASGYPPDLVEQARGLREAADRTVAAARRAGVTIAMGPDSGPQGENSQELARLVDAGLTPMEAIVAATKHGARACGLDDLGTIEAGKAADMFVLDGDPLADVRLFGEPDRRWLVIRGGRVVAGTAISQQIAGARPLLR